MKYELEQKILKNLCKIVVDIKKWTNKSGKFMIISIGLFDYENKKDIIKALKKYKYKIDNDGFLILTKKQFEKIIKQEKNRIKNKKFNEGDLLQLKENFDINGFRFNIGMECIFIEETAEYNCFNERIGTNVWVQFHDFAPNVSVPVSYLKSAE
jgi:hypothetical protein